jgi:hypothetical protein
MRTRSFLPHVLHVNPIREPPLSEVSISPLVPHAGHCLLVDSLGNPVPDLYPMSGISGDRLVSVSKWQSNTRVCCSGADVLRDHPGALKDLLMLFCDTL